MNSETTRSTVPKWILLGLALVTLILLPFVIFEAQIEAFAVATLQSPPGLIQLSVLIAAALAFDVFLPVPSSLVNSSAGALLGFGLATLVCWIGMTLGCLIGYWVGATGGTVLVRRLVGARELTRAERLVGRLGALMLMVTRAVPVLAEASTVAAGAARYPLPRFAAVTAVANLGIAAAYAAVGAFALAANSFLLALGGAIAIPILAYGVLRASGFGGMAQVGKPAISALSGAGTNNGAARATVEEPGAVMTQGAVATFGTTTERYIARFDISYGYPVVFTRNLFDPANLVLSDTLKADGGGVEPARCLVLIDAGLSEADPRLPDRIRAYAAAHAPCMALVGPPQIVPGGEAVKEAFTHIPALYQTLMRHGIDRHAYVIAIGGGAMLDATGFAAATAHRGIRYIRVPTTVLGQNDSGVGVKNAVNMDGVKNYAGTFAPPNAVLNDFAFLHGLPARDRRAGISEAVKVALIRDAAFFAWLERHADALAKFEPAAEEQMIRRSAALHLNQITGGGDPFETGSARPLDFGHWAAHRLETLSGYAMRHGEAVAIGIALDARYSCLVGLLPEGADARIADMLARLGLPTWHPLLDQTDETGAPAILRGLRDFREHLGGALTVTLLRDLGAGEEVHHMDPEKVMQAVDWLRTRQANA